MTNLPQSVIGRTVAIITARGGSKRIPRKNLKAFEGKPIIAYSIRAALDSGCFDEVMVSTDDHEIAEVAGSFGAKVPFLRSEATSGDFAGTAEVVNEVLDEYAKRNVFFEIGCCIYPTAPLLSAAILEQGQRLLAETGADAVVPVVRFSYPIQRAFMIKDGQLEMIDKTGLDKRSQDLMATYHDVGQFYWFRAEAFLKQKEMFMNRTVPIVIPEIYAQDIDTEEDWQLAEFKYRFLNSREAKR